MSNDNENFGLLYSAYHKFYSALKHLNQFCVGNDLFDNISSLDSFFSEYRNITFVLQKSLNKTEYMDDYKSIRDKHFSDPVSKWMVLSRNKVLKQQPFELKKKVIVTIYLPTNSLEFFVQEFTLSNEEEYSVLNHKIMTMIADLKLLEVHFSIEYLFYKEHSQELFEDITVSIINAFNFLQEMEGRIQEDNILVNQLKDKIKKLHFYKTPKEYLFIQDYVYYADVNKFEISQRAYMSFGVKDSPFCIPSKDIRISLNAFDKLFPRANESLKGVFKAFLFQHLFIYQEPTQKVMPTFMVVYEDGTYTLHSFQGTIRTTIYREVNAIAKLIKFEKIKAVLFTCEEYSYLLDDFQELYSMSYPDRILHAKNEFASFYMLSKQEEGIVRCSLDLKRILDKEYIFKQIRQLEWQKEEIKNSFLNPIIRALDDIRSGQ